MPTKGASNQYGYSKGGKTSNYHSAINYKYAKDFNKNTLDQHFNDHGKEMNCNTKEEYKAHAVKFANYVNKDDCTSFIDKNGTTYKYNKKDNILALIDKKGYVITYYKPKIGIKYYNQQKKEKGVRHDKHKKTK